MTRAWHTREELAHQIVTLDKQGEPRRAIARALGVSRNTVRAFLEAHVAGREVEHFALQLLRRMPDAVIEGLSARAI